MKLLWIVALMLLSTSTHAAEYYNQKWFDIPDGAQPRVTLSCAKEACTDVPEVHGFEIKTKRQCACIGHMPKTELLRRDVRIIVSGPETVEDSVRNT